MTTSNNIQKYLENNQKSQFVNKNYLDFRQDLLNYAKEFYSENILDFSETSLGGMFLDFASIVGDSLVFYAEQQFSELDYTTAVDIDNITKHLRRANIKSNTAYPSSLTATFTIEVEKSNTSTQRDPKPNLEHLPVLPSGTRIIADNGVEFTLDEDVDFSVGFTQKIGSVNEDGSPFSLIITKKAICTSGSVITESVNFPDDDKKTYFLSYELAEPDVTDILSVVDEDLNEYYEVEYLSQNTLFKAIKNEIDNNQYMYIRNAPYRYVIEKEYKAKKTTLRFGNGSGKVIKNNVFTNTSDLILPLKNKSIVGRTDVNPNLILENNSLGVSPKGKTLLITYKAGGGTSHNIPKKTLNTFFDDPVLIFKNSKNIIPTQIREEILLSLTVTNEERAVGGAEAPSINDLKTQIPAAIHAQGRIITYEDLIARILTMPSNFGKIEKAVALDNPYSSLSKDLFVICKDSEGFYVNASDAIKINLSNYINEFRLISDNYNILDVPIFNFAIDLQVKVASGYNIESVLFDIQRNIANEMNFSLMQIGEPIDVNRIIKSVSSTVGVLTILTDSNRIIKSKTDRDQFYDFNNDIIRSYSSNSIDPMINFINGFVYPSRGGIFELKYSAIDIKITAN